MKPVGLLIAYCLWLKLNIVSSFRLLSGDILCDTPFIVEVLCSVNPANIEYCIHLYSLDNKGTPLSEYNLLLLRGHLLCLGTENVFLSLRHRIENETKLSLLK